MRRAGGLTGRSAGFVGVDPVLVAVFLFPLFGAPLVGVGQFLLRVLDFTLLCAKLLAELERAGGAVLDAAAAGDAVFFFDVRNVRGPAHVRRVEQLRRAQRIADVDVAVADREDLVFAVDVGDLMDEAVFFALLEDLERLLFGDVMTALLRFHHIVGHIADRDAPAFRVVRAAFVVGLARIAAGAGGGGILAVVFVKPVGDLFEVDRFVFHFDRFFDRNDMHADTAAARGHHRGDLFQRQTCHALKEPAKLRVLFQKRLVHVGKLAGTGDEHRQHPLLFVLLVFIVPLDQTVFAHLRKQIQQVFLCHAHVLDKLFHV